MVRLLVLAVFFVFWFALHGYLYLRLRTVPFLAAPWRRRIVGAALLLLATSIVLPAFVYGRGPDAVPLPLETAPETWLGVLFLLLLTFGAAEVVTGFGLLWKPRLPQVRTAALCAAGLLTAAGLVQGLRPPVVDRYEVTLRGLPRDLDGVRLVQLSDVHLSSLQGERRLGRLVGRVNALEPDLLVLTGDLLDPAVRRPERYVHTLGGLRAPLGVWAIPGNHEYSAGIERAIRVYDGAAFHVLCDTWAEAAPGLIVAGLDDGPYERERDVQETGMARALAGRPAGTTLLLAHAPANPEAAARSGVALMLAGHTHGGQLWPFGLLEARLFPYMAGLYRIGEMALLVSRGVGTWGPPMRLWLPGEIAAITLRSGGSF